MKREMAWGIVLLAQGLFAQGAAPAAPTVAEIPYEAVPNVLKWPATLDAGRSRRSLSGR